jgi:hypothetical protein
VDLVRFFELYFLSTHGTMWRWRGSRGVSTSTTWAASIWSGILAIVVIFYTKSLLDYIKLMIETMEI